MKLPYIKNRRKLQVHCFNYLYSFDLYKDFNSVVELTEFLVKSVVTDPDAVSVKQFEDDEEYITIQVLVDKDVISSVIGKQGIIANAIRTIVQASSYANGLKKVKVNIDSF